MAQNAINIQDDQVGLQLKYSPCLIGYPSSAISEQNSIQQQAPELLLAEKQAYHMPKILMLHSESLHFTQ